MGGGNKGGSSKARSIETLGKDRETIFKDYISHGSYLGTLVLLGCCYAKEKDKAVELEEMLGLSEDPLAQGYLVGYAAASDVLGILDVRLEGTKLNVKDIYQSESFALKELVMNHLARIRESTEELKSSLEKDLKDMKEYFGVEE